MFAYVGVTMSGVQFPLVSPRFYIIGDSEHFRVVHSDPIKQDLTHVVAVYIPACEDLKP